ncbi:ParA family protein [Gimesia panareensis]|uniref:ParA family protein n=1 Tax=Gimesia panareensis TaxID=2527978 RepID=UPI0011881255|nr:ParA family protein [Gimesia panareensis]QDU52958.1 MinD/ParA/CobQ/CobA-like protein [Gimesia panareensis]
MRSTKCAQVITVINLKGGVGKTHTTWLLAGNCEVQEFKVLAVDLDQQGNLSRNLMQDPNCKSTLGSASLFDPSQDVDPTQIIQQSKFPHIDFIAANSALQPLDVASQKEWEPADLQFSLVDLVQQVQGDYDYILFDCPTKLSLTGFAALTASDFVIVPLEPADWGAQGVEKVTQAIDYVKQRHNSRLELLGYLISRIKPRRQYHQIYADELRSRYGKKAFDTMIPDWAGYEQAVTHAVPVNLRRPNSKEARVAREFFAEVETRIREAQSGDRRRRRRVSKNGLTAI